MKLNQSVLQVELASVSSVPLWLFTSVQDTRARRLTFIHISRSAAQELGTVDQQLEVVPAAPEGLPAGQAIALSGEEAAQASNTDHELPHAQVVAGLPVEACRQHTHEQGRHDARGG